VCKEDGLRALQVRVAGDDGLAVSLGQIDERGLRRARARRPRGYL
jgi:hypothetical protein